MKRHDVSGFTLLEILLALAIFAVVAVVAAVGLRAVIRTNHDLTEKEDRVREVLTAVTILRRDVAQLVARPVADTSGARLPGLLVPSRTRFEFTRMGYINPDMQLKRSTLQRVGYAYQNQKLYRYSWYELDRAAHASPNKKLLLSGVQKLNLSFVDDTGQLSEVWAQGGGHGASGLPRAIILTMVLNKLGNLKLILPIRGRGYVSV